MAALGIHEPPIPGMRHACPCCGYPTLGERGGYEICELCDWEDDGQDDPHADEEWGGPNGHYSLTDARRNFRRHGRCTPRTTPPADARRRIIPPS